MSDGSTKTEVDGGTTTGAAPATDSFPCADTCSCGSGCNCGSATRPTILVVGALVGLIVPLAVGLVQRQVGGDGGDDGHVVHSSDGTPAANLPVLGDAAWFYGAMALVLAVGVVHAYVRSRSNACGSTPLGMGIMWGSMLAMAVGMAAGVH